MTFTLNAPMLDFLVLSVIAEGDTYGYQISQIIKRASNTKDSTLYPILKRLQENCLVEAYDMQYQAVTVSTTLLQKTAADISKSCSRNGKLIKQLSTTL